MSTSLFDLLRTQIREPLCLLDVGGHGGALDQWRRFGDKARIFCFEARDDEAAELATINCDVNIEYVSAGLSDDHEPIDITVAAAAGCSSAYPPIRQLYERYPGCALMRPIETVRCAVTTVDDFMASRGVDVVHGMKLDTQGFELRVLKGAERALSRCQFVLVEVEFNPLCEGQPLFGDVDRFLRDRGFVLWRLGNLAHYATVDLATDPHRMLIGADPGRQQVVDVANGQLFWSDAFYVRHEATSVSDVSLDRDLAIAGAALAAQWQFDDLALEMVRKSGDHELLSTAREASGLYFPAEAQPEIPAAEFRSVNLSCRDGMFESDFTYTDTHIVYGPYIPLPWGDFEATFHVSVEKVWRSGASIGNRVWSRR